MERNDGAPGPDVIRLVGLGGVGRHGVEAEERAHGQTFLVDLDLHLDTSEAAATDDLAGTVNYADVARQVIALVEGEPVNLIETLAARIADTALDHALVQAVEVTVHKPEAPVGVPFTDMQVRIRRERSRTAAEHPGTAGGLGAEAPGAQALSAPEAPSAPAAPVQEEGVPVPAAAGSHDGGGVDLDRAPDQPAEVVLGLGGNVGEVRATLRAVVEDLRNAPGLTVGTVSPLARTAAVLAADAVPQQDYLNAVVLATTTLSPNAVLELAQSVEAAYGRERTQRWGERTVDIDVIAYDGVSSSEEHLQLPHPRASERAFVLVPWAQADPDAFLPGLGGGPVAMLAETAPDRGGVRWLALDWLEPARSRTDSGTFAAGAEVEEEAAAQQPIEQQPQADGDGPPQPADPMVEEVAAPQDEGGEGAEFPLGASSAAEPDVGAPEVAEPATIEPDTGMPPTVSPAEARPSAPAVSPQDPVPEAAPAPQDPVPEAAPAPQDPVPEAAPAPLEAEESDFQTQIRPAADSPGAAGGQAAHLGPPVPPDAAPLPDDPDTGRPSAPEPPDEHRAVDEPAAAQSQAQPPATADQPAADQPAADPPAADPPAADLPGSEPRDPEPPGSEPRDSEPQGPPAADEQQQFRPRWQPLHSDESS